eukprot:GFYU01007550.1.p1 GENE.GFYU01007550.1~~GFYU01007550.1.p1  ORF type:complete len:248 (-),score=75.75 GFYU01007550.1:227-922(-)
MQQPDGHFRTAVEMTYSILWSMLLMNVIMGQLLDSFAEIRSKKNARIVDSRERCFICNIDRFQFEQHANGFERHVTEEHNPLSYLFLLQHLKQSDPVNFDGVESYINDSVLERECDFLPVDLAVSLKYVDSQQSEAEERIIRQEQMLETTAAKQELSMAHMAFKLDKVAKAVAAHDDDMDHRRLSSGPQAKAHSNLKVDTQQSLYPQESDSSFNLKTASSPKHFDDTDDEP